MWSDYGSGVRSFSKQMGCCFKPPLHLPRLGFLVQDTSPALAAIGGQRAWWCLCKAGFCQCTPGQLCFNEEHHYRRKWVND